MKIGIHHFILKFLILIFVFSCISVAQTKKASIKGRITNQLTGSPLRDVNIYLDGTSFGTTTSRSGKYDFKGIPPGEYNIIISRVGFEKQVRRYRFKAGKEYDFDVRMKEEPIELGEISVTAEADTEWQRLLEMFKKVFLGETTFAEKTELVNPEIIDFELDKSEVLHAVSNGKLKVKNNALGYLINLDIKKFEWAMRNDIGMILAFSYYEELEPENEAQLAEWEKNRMNCYKGSMRHFLRSAAAGKVFENGFAVSYRRQESEWDRIRKYNAPEVVNGLVEDHVTKHSDNYYSMNSERIIEVIYKGEQDPQYFYYLKQWKKDPYNPEGYQMSKIMFRNGPLYFDDYGYYEDTANTLVIGGYLAWKRYADRLPLNYNPEL